MLLLTFIVYAAIVFMIGTIIFNFCYAITCDLGMLVLQTQFVITHAVTRKKSGSWSF